MKGGKAGRKRPANAPPDPAKFRRGPSRGETKKDWGAIEKDPTAPPPVRPDGKPPKP